jgi:oligopeptide/dipeptide ABC transporter ATP-binding protein
MTEFVEVEDSQETLRPSSKVNESHTSGAAPGSVLSVTDLSVGFSRGRQKTAVVRGISLSIGEAQSVAVIGESGSGKTVTARAIIGLLPDYAQISGSIKFKGQELVGLDDNEMRKHRGNDIAMVFQDPSRSLDPTMRIGRQIGEAIRQHEELSKSDVSTRAIELLERVRIPAAGQRVNEYPHQLSGGMRQRVMIAIALASQQKLLIADEATTALDVTTQAQIMTLLVELRREFGMALLIISHDLRLASAYSDEVYVMYRGRIVERAPTPTLFSDVRMPYTRALFNAIPQLDAQVHGRFPTVKAARVEIGTAEGCPFATRCPKAESDCFVSEPELLEQEPDHYWSCWHPEAVAASARYLG